MRNDTRQFRHLALAPAFAHLGAAAAIFVFAMCGSASAQDNGQEDQMNIRVIIDGTVLTATLDDSAAARDFASLLPLDLSLSDYASTEKVADLPRRLETDGAPRSYQPSRGDITYYAPWGNLAIFYRDFRDSAGLVPLGTFDGDLDALLRDGTFTARFELAE